ncbi:MULTISPECIES: BlaI/MecI/CopY family transcriptional regulator [Oscillospiraceae]|uniref:BlaI/MecI/CopY family transcriptional regulator n=1 Tax=Oscillospiraceae TaxID=216572 RepID=UPI000B3A29CE|nr:MULTISPECIES: BlaI/MecI/CopY family transcriptional regulator [Oscillospiraceae]MBM6884934.1 BlaI/MecI/CopY family transcriptional regulator [Pseudoflavonifractor phocaeensis]OUO42802.1 BlaI/MecI/CopY family transcriptional regulator [Flavonifractor sp. An306]
MEDFKLFDAEYKLMELLWERQPINSTALSRLCQEKLGWKKSTTFNLVRKLGERGILKNENATVTALIQREQVLRRESEAAVAKSFGGSLPNFVAAFLSGKKLSHQEAEELRRLIDESEARHD